MKNSVALLALISSMFLYGMDTDTQIKVPLYAINGTAICLIKGSICDLLSTTFGLIVVGKNQQRKLKKPKLGDCAFVGQMNRVKNNNVYEIKEKVYSASDDDTYKPFNSNNTEQLWQNASSYRLDTTVIAIIEPRISFGAMQYQYVVRKKNKGLFCDIWYSGEEVLAAAKQDLAMCYKKVLSKGAKEVANKDYKSIALPTLSTEVGFPRIEAAHVAVAAIIDFIENNKKSYDLVHLCVKKRSEFTLYQELLEKHMAAKVE